MAALVAGFVTLAAAWDLYWDTVPEIHPSRDGVHALSSMPFVIANNSRLFKMTGAVFECLMTKYVAQASNKDFPGSITVTDTKPITSKEKDIEISRKGSRLFRCDITPSFDGINMTRTNVWRDPNVNIPVPFAPESLTVIVKVTYKTALPFYSWPRSQFVSEPFVLTYTKDGYFWSEREPIG